MNRKSGPGWGPVEYALLIVVIFLVLFTIFSIFWPAISMFYNNSLQ